jgi:hypothetical protein
MTSLTSDDAAAGKVTGSMVRLLLLLLLLLKAV